MQDIELPLITLTMLPPVEREHGWHLLTQIREMDTHVRYFGAAVSLFDFCQSKLLVRLKPQDNQSREDVRTLCAWQFIAARDGAMTICHFAEAMEAVRRGLHTVPTLRGQVNHSKLRGAVKTFKKHFPNFREIRNAVAHTVELTMDSERYMKNSSSNDFDDGNIRIENACHGMLKNNLSGRNYTLTIKSQILSYEVSSQTQVNLQQVAREFFSGFPPSGAHLGI